MKPVVCGLILAATLAAGFISSAIGQGTPATPTPPNVPNIPATQPKDALSFKMKDIDGKEVDLSAYKGKVILMVNVASKCGNTPQYTDLEAIYEKYKEKGFVIMGFPANNFGSQEPGSNEDIKEFCTSTYAVKFPMFSKISVKGADKDPLYQYLTGLELKPLSKGEVAWNFEKFLIGKDGKAIGRFGNKLSPSSPTITTAIEAALKEEVK